jgi:hypothetical protein
MGVCFANSKDVNEGRICKTNGFIIIIIIII